MTINLKDHLKNNPHLLNKNVYEFEEYEIERINASLIIPKEQPWLWFGFIPLHTSILFAGYGGIGKSLLLLQLASDISNGNKIYPCGLEYQLPQGNIIILTAEDDFEYQTVPKLIAANANLQNIHLLKCVKAKVSGKRKFIDLFEQLDLLETEIQNIGNVKLIIIDPISYFTGTLKDHVNTEVCNFIDSLNYLAKKYDLSIIFNKHLRKQSSHSTITNAINEVAGGGAWINSPRQSWLISPHPKEQEKIVLVNLKSNVAKKGQTCLAYTIKEITIPIKNNTIKTTSIQWCEQTVDLNANEAMSRESFDKSKEQICTDFILDYLDKHGDSVQKNVIESAKSEKIAERTCERMLRKLKNEKIIYPKKGFGISPILSLEK